VLPRDVFARRPAVAALAAALLLCVASDAEAHTARAARRARCMTHRSHRSTCHRARPARPAAHPAAHPAAAAPAVVAPVVPAECPDADLFPNAQDLERIAAATMCLVNQQRQAAGEVALAEDGRLDAAAAGHTEDMLAEGYFAHDSPAGQTPVDRLFAVGYLVRGVGYAVGENLAIGIGTSTTPQQTVLAWMSSPEHRANILNPVYRQTGVGVLSGAPGIDPSAGAATYTQEFGAILTQP
jgi:uncharacterized protein YkwD